MSGWAQSLDDRDEYWKLAHKAIFEKRAIQKIHELAALVRDIQNRGKDIKTVLEIGTQEGGTLWLWGQLANPKAKIQAIDPNFLLPGTTGLVQPTQILRLTPFRSDDPRAVLAAKAFLGEIDLLFIDGDHTYAGIQKDWENYGPLVRNGGLVVFHDINISVYAGSEVDTFWREIRTPFCREYIFHDFANYYAGLLPPECCGIGVMPIHK